LKEEFYFQMRFRESDKRWTPILTFDPEAKDPAKVVAWAVERSDGGRGFASTGGHFHKNWWNDNVRKLIHNAILWTAKAEVPSQGVVSTVPADTK
jgi:type 1 glutamine amidotransferase